MTTPVTTATVPEIWFKAKRVIRTVLAVVISIIITLAAAILSVNTFAPQILDELAKILPAGAIAWLVGALAFLATIAGVITRIMAIPQVNAFLTKIGAGSVPASALPSLTVTPTVTVTPTGDASTTK